MHFFLQSRFHFILINVYSDSSQLALKYLQNTKVNISNVLIMTGDFNIRNSLQNSNYSYYSIYRNMLSDIADSFQLELSQPGILTTIETPTQSQTLYFFVCCCLNSTVIISTLIGGSLLTMPPSQLISLSLMNTSLPSDDLLLQEVTKKSIFLKNSLFSSKEHLAQIF